MKIHGQAPLKLLSMSTLRRLRYLKNVSMKRKITTSKVICKHDNNTWNNSGSLSFYLRQFSKGDIIWHKTT